MRLAAILLTFTTLTGCAKSVNMPDAPPIPYDSVELFTPYGWGQGCPVDGKIYTARHVLEAKRGVYTHASWGDRHGNGGLASLIETSDFVDGAVLQPLKQFPMPVEVGPLTEDLYFFDFSYENSEDAFTPVVRRAKLVRPIAGRMVVFAPSPTPGASGGCLFNNNGEAVGIVVWGLPMEKYGDSVGLGLRFPEEGME